MLDTMPNGAKYFSRPSIRLKEKNEVIISKPTGDFYILRTIKICRDISIRTRNND